MQVKKCRNCGEPIPATRQASAVYCSDSCKARYHEKKQEQHLSGHDLIPPLPPTTKTEYKEPPALWEQLRGVIDNAPEEKPKAEEQQHTPEPQPEPKPKFLQIQVETPKYKEAKATLDKLQQMKKRVEQDIQQANNKLKQITGDNGQGWQLGGALAGAFLPALWQDTTPKKKKKQDSDTFWQILLGAGLGLLAGSIAKEATQKNRQQEQQQHLAKIRAEISSLSQTLNEVNRKIRYVEGQMFFIQQYETRVIEQTGLLSGFNFSAGMPKPTTPEPKTRNTPTPQEPEAPKINTTDKLISSRELKNQRYKSLNFLNEWNAFLGKPAINFRCAVHGKPGEGKSTFCIKFANYLAKNFGNVVYVSGEEGFCLTLQEKVTNMKAVTDGLYFADLATYDEIKQEIPADTFHFIFIDSLDTMKIDAARMRELCEYYKNSAIISISQSTKDGKMRGSNEIAHDADITISVADGIASTTKNRFKERGTEYQIFDKDKGEDENKDSGKIIPFQPRNVI